ncbi:MAG: hypothetical protein N2691_03080 [Patescibacteria group bacterium]|nr:hypothetical protein [Patescibacteria group bacterium]
MSAENHFCRESQNIDHNRSSVQRLFEECHDRTTVTTFPKTDWIPFVMTPKQRPNEDPGVTARKIAGLINLMRLRGDLIGPDANGVLRGIMRIPSFSEHEYLVGVGTIAYGYSGGYGCGNKTGTNPYRLISIESNCDRVDAMGAIPAFYTALRLHQRIQQGETNNGAACMLLNTDEDRFPLKFESKGVWYGVTSVNHVADTGIRKRLHHGIVAKGRDGTISIIRT